MKINIKIVTPYIVFVIGRGIRGRNSDLNLRARIVKMIIIAHRRSLGRMNKTNSIIKYNKMRNVSKLMSSNPLSAQELHRGSSSALIRRCACSSTTGADPFKCFDMRVVFGLERRYIWVEWSRGISSGYWDSFFLFFISLPFIFLLKI